MHDVAVALDEKLVGDGDSADLCDAADVIAAEIEQHQMLGALLRVGQQFVLQRFVFVRRRAARAGAGDRADGDDVAGDLDQDFRARAGDGEAAEIEKIKIRRRVGPPQRAVERERRQRERRLETLREHDLEGVAGGDVVLCRAHHRLVFVPASYWIVAARRAGPRRIRQATCRAAGRDFRQCRRAARPHASSAVLASTPFSGRTGVTTVIESFTASNTTMMVGRTSTASGMPIGSGFGRRQFLHQPHHVVAEIAEHAGGHRRQAVGQCDAAFRDQRAQRLERRLGAGRERFGLCTRARD